MKMMEPSCLYSGNATFVESLYESFLQDPDSVPPEWREYFARLRDGDAAGRTERPHTPVRQAFTGLRATRPGAAAASDTDAQVRKQVAVLQLINAYRFRGHRRANLDPLQQYERPDIPELGLPYHGLSEADLDQEFNTGSLVGPEKATLREILARLKATYCGTIGAEYMHIDDTAQKRWIQQRLEGTLARPSYTPEHKRAILERLIAANALERYLHTRYVGQKRFSLEGGESTIAALDRLTVRAAEAGVRESVLGMAHRGRINVLVNILGKPPADLFDEFEGRPSAHTAGQKAGELKGSGDVKYHLGYSADLDLPAGPMHVTLAFNPSHLEIIDPVVEGSVRARQDRRRDAERTQVLPVLLHGDGAFAGQGVVMETFELSQTRGYSTGGTVHFIINNQIAFTTSDPLDSRSTLYCTDVAKMVQAPIFHVNGDDPEAVTFLAELALDYRMAFHKDVVVDIVCYRRHGHSEADEPAATQPIMYQKIRQHPSVREIYAQRLIEEGVVSEDDVKAMEHRYLRSLEHGEVVSRPIATDVHNPYRIDYSPYFGTRWTDPADTAIDRDRVRELGEAITAVPEDFVLHPAVRRMNEARRRMAAGEAPADWGFAELLAYASLTGEGHPVRLSGQDSARGTFFHRHAVLHDQHTGRTFVPLRAWEGARAEFLVINSPLSEEAVLGFEYGYASAAPEGLVIWEAQFGDFANGAQVVIDQFISSAEAKWGRLCGLTMFLPHGYDGQGPEHSSARLERYLQLCAEMNMQVCFPSTPAQMFHMLRRQVLRPYRKPLVVMSPKSLLRHPLSVSAIEELTDGRFRNVIDEVDPLDPERVTRVLVCSGKVYYDLLAARREHDIDDIAIVRLEQLYPFPREDMQAAIARYANATEVVWVQEEPRNQGAWDYLSGRLYLLGCLHENQRLEVVARPYSAAPAVGYLWLHKQQQEALVNQALRLETAADAVVRKRA